MLICLPGGDVTGLDPWIYKLHPDKLIHAIMFGVMGWLFILPFYKSDFAHDKKVRIFILITCLICIWGFITECIQLYIPSRDFDLLDWGADTLGAFIAFLLIRKSVEKNRKHSL